MNDSERADHEALTELVGHPGWAVLERHTKERMEAFRKGCPFNISTVEDLRFHQGVIATLSDLLALPDKLAAAIAEEGDAETGED